MEFPRLFTAGSAQPNQLLNGHRRRASGDVRVAADVLRVVIDLPSGCNASHVYDNYRTTTIQVKFFFEMVHRHIAVDPRATLFGGITVEGGRQV